MSTQEITPVLGTVAGAVETLAMHPNVTQWDGVPVARWRAEAARRYAAMGFRVVPLHGKIPSLVKGIEEGKGGFHMCSNDPARVNTWWRRWPNANIGCRPPRGVVVVDIDTKNGGHLIWKRITQGRTLPPTLAVCTGSGGWHLWFTLPYSGELRATLGGKASGIDLMHYRRGLVVMPPSINPKNGGLYLIHTWAQPAPLPHWLTPHVYRPLPPVPAPRGELAVGAGDGAGLVKYVAEATDGGRNKALNWAAYTAVKDGLSIEDELTRAAQHAGLGDAEIRNTLASARRAGVAAREVTA